MFERIFFAGWADVDFNGHMKNAAYLNKAGDVRLMFFAAHNFPASEFARLKIGPVAMKDEVEYFREINLLEEIRVTQRSAGLAPDGSRFKVRNEFYKSNGKLAGQVSTIGGWLDLKARKLVVPPPALLAALQSLSKTDDFQVLPSSIKG